MPIAPALGYAVFTVWVSLCAFAPELIWQGFRLMRGHFGLAEALSALFIGALFAFFVEPLIERLKAGRWHLPHEPRFGLLLGSAVAVAFGFVVVCLHEAIAAYLGGGHGGGHGEEGRQEALVHALDHALEWASIPAAVTASWFVAGTWRGRRVAAGSVVAVAAWIVAVGLFYGWGWRPVATSLVPCVLLAFLGTRLARRRWDGTTVPALARLTALVAAAWLLLSWLSRLVAPSLGSSFLPFHAPGALTEDLRFYLGWALGLFVAPNPLEED